MNWHEGHINKYARVLLENPKNGYISGYTDNYIKMVFHDYEKEMQTDLFELELMRQSLNTAVEKF